MTTNELEGRELAEAAARAMGWRIKLDDSGTEGTIFNAEGKWCGPTKSVGCYDCGNSDTGWPTEREMLAWLADAAGKSDGDISVVVIFSHEKSYVLFADCDREGECGVDYAYERIGMRPGFHPEDLLEALQRLVVAVKEREKKA